MINVPGIASYGTGFSDATFIQNNQNWQDILSINHGSHSFKTGAIVQCGSGCPGAGALFANTYTRVHYDFNNLFDFAKDTPYDETNIGFNPKTGQQTGPNFRPVFLNFGVFFQDDWKVRSNLTVSMGLRWEVYMNPWDHDNIFVGATFPTGSNYLQRITDLTPVVKQPLDHTDWNNIVTRLGIAWDPKGDGKSSVRAGFGMFTDRASGQFWNDAGTSLPVIGLAQANKQTGISPVYGLSTSTKSPWLFPAPPLHIGLDASNGLIGIPSSINVWDPNMKTMYTFNYFFGIQRSFFGNWAVEANYVGSKGTKTYMGFDVNRYAGDLLDGTLNRINSSFAGIDYGQARGSSFYNGFNASVRKRYNYGLTFQAAYTYGKAIDDSSSFGLGLNVVDANNLKDERGLADFDVRNKFALSLLYNTPRLQGNKFLSFLSSWELCAITILQSGSPYSVYCDAPFNPVLSPAGKVIGNTGCDYNGDGFNWDRPNAPAFAAYQHYDKQQFLNGIFPVSAFPVPGLGVEGNLGRNMFYGPGYANVNFNVVKHFPLHWLGEQGMLDFRTEFFNFFNRTNLSTPQTGGTWDLTSSQFGKATTALGGRNIQFGVRVQF